MTPQELRAIRERLSQTIRITKAQIFRVRCGAIYTAEQVAAARPGTPGEGGVILR